MFHDCAQALNVDISGWPAMPMFQPPPPPPPHPVPSPSPPPVDVEATIQAQQEEEAALAADDLIGDL